LDRARVGACRHGESHAVLGQHRVERHHRVVRDLRHRPEGRALCEAGEARGRVGQVGAVAAVDEHQAKRREPRHRIKCLAVGDGRQRLVEGRFGQWAKVRVLPRLVPPPRQAHAVKRLGGGGAGGGIARQTIPQPLVARQEARDTDRLDRRHAASAASPA
jgi:hypothetical protein